MTDAELLSAAIEASGLSVTAFCRDVLLRNPRTVWRWLDGTNPLPQVVRDALEKRITSAPSRPPPAP